MTYRYRTTVYHISVTQVHGAPEGPGAAGNLTVDGVARSDGVIPLVDDQGEHQVLVTLTMPGS
jgi:hypothetical protein